MRHVEKVYLNWLRRWRPIPRVPGYPAGVGRYLFVLAHAGQQPDTLIWFGSAEIAGNPADTQPAIPQTNVEPEQNLRLGLGRGCGAAVSHGANATGRPLSR